MSYDDTRCVLAVCSWGWVAWDWVVWGLAGRGKDWMRERQVSWYEVVCDMGRQHGTHVHMGG